MFSGLDTGDKPSAIQSGKLDIKNNTTLAETESIIPEKENKTGIIKKVVIFFIIAIISLVVFILIFSFFKKDNKEVIIEQNNTIEEEAINNIKEEIIIEEPIIDLSKIDDDSDGLSNAEEIELGTDIYNPDTDNDGLFDREEVKIWGTNPLDPDSDNDGNLDGVEVENGYNPLGDGKLPGLENFDIIEADPNLLDNDEDGLTNAQEIELGTDLNNPDTDGDGYLDGAEVENGYNPLGEGTL